MKRREIQSLHEKTKEELKKLLEEERLSLVKLRMDLALGKTKNVKAPARKRDKIARILTIIREKEILEEASYSKKNNKKGDKEK